ncbi:hypothetical protein JTB14_006986 [Gonioctena quinquepunctata]|nr:hypothetical protein JTB14_006986 [Gonioctena quinquepunctata]
MTRFAEMIKYIAGILGLVSTNHEGKAVEGGLRECAKAIKRMNYALKNAVSMGERQHLEASLRHVKSLRAQLKTAKKHGAGLEVTKETAKHRVNWDDSTSAFNSRIKTGVITNLKHKDTKAFLIDCKSLFKRRVQNALRLNESVKVNTAFSGEFELTKGDKIQSEFKYFTTSNSAIYKDTNLDSWLMKKLLTPLI